MPITLEILLLIVVVAAAAVFLATTYNIGTKLGDAFFDGVCNALGRNAAFCQEDSIARLSANDLVTAIKSITATKCIVLP